MRSAPAPASALDPNVLKPFVDALPVPALAKPDGTRMLEGNSAKPLPFYRVEMRAFEAKLHRDLGPAELWGYDGAFPGPTFDTRSGEGFLVEWANRLPATHLLPLDRNLHGAEAEFPDVRTVVHAHGAKAPPESDGYPEAWLVPGQSALYHYPNAQDAATLWYHDHALGITRLNVYAGLLGAFIVRDDVEAALELPSGEFEIPLILCDRVLKRAAGSRIRSRRRRPARGRRSSAATRSSSTARSSRSSTCARANIASARSTHRTAASIT